MSNKSNKYDINMITNDFTIVIRLAGWYYNIDVGEGIINKTN